MPLAASLLLALAIAPSGPIAHVEGGALRGSLWAPGAVFKGVPFAAPPVGDLRWRAPQPVQPWRGVRDATRYSPACIQNPIGTGAFIAPLARRYGVNYATHPWNLSEDCLYLNIWTPQWPPAQPAAVMVWIHGGSNVAGSGNEPAYDGTELAKRGVFVVTVNYRLGPLGFFAHPELTRESPHRSSGNYGLLDQIAALQWVRRNIAQFGGDPARVTLFGESAGAIDIGMLMCSPLATGLFQRAIAESGPALGLAFPQGLAAGERAGQRVAPGATIAQWRALPPQAIVRAAGRQSGFVLDGWALPRSPEQVFAAGAQQPAALMIGNNGREASAFRYLREPASVGEGARKTLRICYGNMAAVAFAMWAVDAQLGRLAAADQWLNDALMTCPSAAMATLHAAAGHPAFVYQFRRSIPGQGQNDLGSFHSLELPYVFRAFQNPGWNWLPFAKVDESLGQTIQSYWTNFAKSGDPNGGSLPQWRPFSPKSEDYIEFTAEGQAVPRRNVRPALCDLDVPRLKQRLLANR